jgi:hypothetical protein
LFFVLGVLAVLGVLDFVFPTFLSFPVRFFSLPIVFQGCSAGFSGSRPVFEALDRFLRVSGDFLSLKIRF